MKVLLTPARLFGLALVGVAGLTLVATVEAGRGGGGHASGGHGGVRPSGGNSFNRAAPAFRPSVPSRSVQPAMNRGSVPAATGTTRTSTPSVPMHSVQLSGNLRQALSSSSVQMTGRGRQASATVSAQAKGQARLTSRGQAGATTRGGSLQNRPGTKPQALPARCSRRLQRQASQPLVVSPLGPGLPLLAVLGPDDLLLLLLVSSR